MDEGRGKNSQIFCLTWVKRGAAKLDPEQIILNPDELKLVIESEKVEDDHVQENDSISDSQDSDTNNDYRKDSPEREETRPNIEDALDEYGLDNYDEEDENLTTGISGFVAFADNNDDPYITKKSKSKESNDSDSEDELAEKSAVQIKSDDNLLVCARCGQHSSVLEVYVYNHESNDFYVHHDIPLLETPLCMQWIGFDPGADDVNAGNLLAVGNFNGTIDIWDLDVLNTLEPISSIGKGKVPRLNKNTDFRHADAILDVSWTYLVNDKLASASADTVVALWDLELGKALRVFRDHKNKVQTLAWRPKSDKHLLSGAFDGKIHMIDTRESRGVTTCNVNGEVERIIWNNDDEHYFIASSDCGEVYYFDVRKPTDVIHQWKAHDGAIPGLSLASGMSANISCLLYTASSDGFAKLWDVSVNEIKLVHEKDMKMGMVHCCGGNPDENSVVAFGGQKGQVRLWDVMKTTETAKYLEPSSEFSQQNLEDTLLSPMGGEGDHDDDEVLEYIGGEDYINYSKITKISEQNMNTLNGTGDSIKKKRKRKKKSISNTLQNTVSSNIEIVEPSRSNGSEAMNSNKKKRKRKKKSTCATVQNTVSNIATIEPSTSGESPVMAKKKRKRKRKKSTRLNQNNDINKLDTT